MHNPDDYKNHSAESETNSHQINTLDGILGESGLPPLKMRQLRKWLSFLFSTCVLFENPGTHDKSYTKLKFEPVASGTVFCEILQHSRCWNSALENIFLTETISKAPPIEGWSFVTNFTGLFIGSWLNRSLITANAPFTSVWYYSIRKFMALPPTQACPSFPTSPKSFQIFWVISMTNDGVWSSRKGERNHTLAFSEFNRFVPLPLQSINQGRCLACATFMHTPPYTRCLKF